jgi:hypothetical protein
MFLVITLIIEDILKKIWRLNIFELIINAFKLY